MLRAKRYRASIVQDSFIEGGWRSVVSNAKDITTLSNSFQKLIGIGLSSTPAISN